MFCVKSYFLAAVMVAVALMLVSCSSSKRETASPVPTTRTPVAAPSPAPSTLVEPQIRVAIKRAEPEVRLVAGPGGAVLSDLQGQEVGRLVAGQELTIRAAAGSSAVRVSSSSLARNCNGCVDAKGGSLIRANGTPLARRITVWANGAGTLTTVVWLNLEDYLQGVLAGEVPYHRWAPEALKAQAIVSRSYALHQMKVRQAEPYDVETTEASQVFRLGVGNEPILQRTVNATRGQVVTCDGKLFPAYFHSTCGGATTDAKHVFPSRTTAKTLCGTHCPFCKASPAYQWRWQVSKTELGRRLGLRSPVIAIETATDKTGRAETVRVRYAGGIRTFQGNQFRLLVSSRELKSMRWTSVQDTGTQFRFEGRGFGHGVGMCQYGSDGMARAGYSCEQILGLYFPGGELTTLYGTETAAK